MPDRQLRRAVDAAFAATGLPDSTRVGAEVELLPTTTPLLGYRDPVAASSLEPGGQLELSLPPRAGVAELVADTAAAIRRAQAAARAVGRRLALVGIDPRRDWRQVPLATPTARYLAMEQLFDAQGEDGRRMMRLTASLQVCVDLLPGRAGREQWLVANLAGPALTSAFANSGSAARTRTAIWRGVDLRRTGYDGRHLDPADPVGAYHDFAARAQRLAIPGGADAGYHLSTLFPPVRPRGGYLEIRYLDAQPVRCLADVIGTVHTLLTDPTARRLALELLLPHLTDLDRDWAVVAAGGTAAAQHDLLAIARTESRRAA